MNLIADSHAWVWFARDDSQLSPLAREAMLAASRRLQGIADDLGASRAQLAIAWCLTNPAVSTVIVGASRREQLAHNLAAVGLAETLTPEIRERVAYATCLDTEVKPEATRPPEGTHM